MNHFTLEDWIDFVRRLKSPPVTAQMQQHLDEGCGECLKAVRIWRDLFAFGSSERLYSPPGRALRSVQGYYRLLRAQRRGSRVAIMARLLFDSLLEPLPAGIRSSQPSPRQLVYSAGKVLIDLRLERRLDRIHIVGQAQRRSLRGPEVGERDVLVLQETKTVARTRCNQFGEFQFDLESAENREYSIVLKGANSFVVPLRLAE
jgi:hypothetical protein